MVVAVLIMFFAPQVEGALVASRWEALKFFTVESNILMGISALISIIYIAQNKNPLWVSILKYISTGAVTLTFITVIVYLTPLVGFLALITGPNLYMHLIIPILSLVHFFIFEPRQENFKFYNTFLYIIPMGIYGLAYMINVAVSNGYGTVENDWYAFGTYGLGIGFLVYFIMLLLTYAMGIGLYFAYKKIKIFK